MRRPRGLSGEESDIENSRTESARANDDSATIDGIEPGTGQQDRSGGNLARDVSTDAERNAIEEPANHERPTKQDDIDDDQACRTQRPRD